MEGYRGGALGFKAGSFHAIGANLFQRKRRYLPVFAFLTILRKTIEPSETATGPHEQGWRMFEWRRMMRFEIPGSGKPIAHTPDLSRRFGGQ